MADRIGVDMIVSATTRGFEKVNKDMTGLAKSTDEVDKAAKKTEGGIGRLSGALKAAAAGALVAAGAAMLQFARNSVNAASAVEEATSKFNVVFANSADAVRAAIDEFADSANRSKFALREWVGTLGDTFKPLGFTEEAAGELAVTITQLGVDLASFNNMPMDDALRRLQSTLIGNHENALAFGVIINENTLKAELAANGWDKLTGAQLEQAKVQARINILMRGTSDAQGDAVRTADSYANTTAAMSAAVEELSVTFGQILLPTATAAAKALTELASALQTSIDSKTREQTVQDIVAQNIALADGVDDLILQYQKIERQTGIEANFIGLGPTLQKAMDDVAEAFIFAADSADEYVRALDEVGLIGNRAGQTTEEAARAYYEKARAAAAVVEMERQVAEAYSIVADEAGGLTEVTDTNTLALYEWNSTVAAQQREAQQAADAMQRKADAMRADEEATRAAEQAMLDWYKAALNSSGAAFVVDEKTGEMALSVENANQQLYDMVEASGTLGPEALALFGVALGVVSEDAANAALKSMLFTKGLEAIVDEALSGGPLTVGVIKEIQGEMSTLLDTISETPDIVDIEFETDAWEAQEAARLLREELMATAGQYDILFNIQTQGSIPGAPAAPPGGSTPLPFAGGTGGQFMSVPPGYPNDSYLIALQSGEDFMVRTPGDRQRGTGAMTINVDARGAAPGVGSEVERAVRAALAQTGRQTDQRMRA